MPGSSFAELRAIGRNAARPSRSSWRAWAWRLSRSASGSSCSPVRAPASPRRSHGLRARRDLANHEAAAVLEPRPLTHAPDAQPTIAVAAERDAERTVRVWLELPLVEEVVDRFAVAEPLGVECQGCAVRAEVVGGDHGAPLPIAAVGKQARSAALD